MDGSTGFVVTISSLARSYWYVLARILGFCFLIRLFDQTQMRIRLVRISIYVQAVWVRSSF